VGGPLRSPSAQGGYFADDGLGSSPLASIFLFALANHSAAVHQGRDLHTRIKGCDVDVRGFQLRIKELTRSICGMVNVLVFDRLSEPRRHQLDQDLREARIQLQLQKDSRDQCLRERRDCFTELVANSKDRYDSNEMLAAVRISKIVTSHGALCQHTPDILSFSRSMLALERAAAIPVPGGDLFSGGDNNDGPIAYDFGSLSAFGPIVLWCQQAVTNAQIAVQGTGTTETDLYAELLEARRGRAREGDLLDFARQQYGLNPSPNSFRALEHQRHQFGQAQRLVRLLQGQHRNAVRCNSDAIAQAREAACMRSLVLISGILNISSGGSANRPRWPGMRGTRIREASHPGPGESGSSSYQNQQGAFACVDVIMKRWILDHQLHGLALLHEVTQTGDILNRASDDLLDRRVELFDANARLDALGHADAGTWNVLYDDYRASVRRYSAAQCYQEQCADVHADVTEVLDECRDQLADARRDLAALRVSGFFGTFAEDKRAQALDVGTPPQQ